jgi:4-hydroxy-tetrahydrodipicolinate reductase
MNTIVLGDGPMGRALHAALAAAADVGRATLLGRPDDPAGHSPRELRSADVVLDFSRAAAVMANVRRGLEAGCRAFVIGTTGWDADRPRAAALLEEHRGAAVAAANFSPGLAILADLVEEASRRFGAFEAFDPFIVEWHRAAKADRPSGTAKELSRRLLAAHPVKRRLADPSAGLPPAADELELAAIRAGASPGMHLVGFDAPGETVELRITARDRSAYAAGALEAARWLLREPRSPGIHPFSEVVGERSAPPVATLAINA